MADSKMASEVYPLEQAPVDERSKIIEKCFQELFAASKTLESDNYRARSDLDLMRKLWRNKEMGYQQLQSHILNQDMRISSLEERVKHLENGTYDGVSLIEVSNYSQKKYAERSGSPCIYSDDFYTSRHGYRMCAQIYLNGDGTGRGSHLSVFFVLKKGHYDHILSWPFPGHVTFTLLNQDSKDRLTYTLIPKPLNPSFQKPTEGMNIASGCDLFVAHQKIENPEEGFLKNDTIAIEVKVDLPDL